MQPRLIDALAALDRDIADAQARLDELMQMRRGAEALARYANIPIADDDDSMTGKVLTVLRRNRGRSLNATEIYDAIYGNSGLKVPLVCVRNAIYYGVRTNRIAIPVRGHFILKESM